MYYDQLIKLMLMLSATLVVADFKPVKLFNALCPKIAMM